MKYSEISGLSKAELLKKREAATGELFSLRMKNMIGQVSNPMSVRAVRRDIARINTALKTKKN